jgi:hypothetical protein
MLKQTRHHLIDTLWQLYRAQSPQMQLIESKLTATPLTLDHFAIIDLPGPHSGIQQLKNLFSLFGYVERGRDYLADKQNDFLWLAENDSDHSPANTVLPQIVVADFRLEALPKSVRQVIEKYSAQALPAPTQQVAHLLERIKKQDHTALTEAIMLTQQYLAGRDWPLPTVAEYESVKNYNELLAWVLIYGRRPNHFTLSVHLMPQFNQLADFLSFIESATGLPLNHDGGLIKGSVASGIEQASTVGEAKTIALADGKIDITANFVEFVWRHPIEPSQKPSNWDDYFTGFVGQHADYVIESLYSPDTERG